MGQAGRKLLAGLLGPGQAPAQAPARPRLAPADRARDQLTEAGGCQAPGLAAGHPDEARLTAILAAMREAANLISAGDIAGYL